MHDTTCMKMFLELQVCVFIYFITSYTFQFISGDIMQNKYAEEERPVSFSIKKSGKEIMFSALNVYFKRLYCIQWGPNI